MTAPPPIVRTDSSGGQSADGSWGAPSPWFPPGGITGQLVHADDGLGGRLGCEELANADEIAGNIALISRGVCEFGVKALNAQNAGAIAFVIYQDNRVPDTDCETLVFMGGGAQGINTTLNGLFIARCVAVAILPTVDSEPVTARLENACLPLPCTVDIEPGPITESTVHVARPNPFVTTTEFGVQLVRTQNVTVEVFNTLGQRVALLHDGPLAAGGVVHTFTLEASSLPSGVYLYRVTGEDFVQTNNVVLAR